MSTDAPGASADSPGEQALTLELTKVERQLQDANLNNEALVRVIHQMQLEQEALERKWQRERLGREVIERNWKLERGNSIGSTAAVDLAAEADARVAAREAAHVLQRQASLLLATQEHRMQLMTLRLDTMHEQLDAICPRAHVLAGDEPVPAAAEGDASLQVELPSSVAEWAECMPGGLCLESASLWVAPEGAGSGGVGVHGRRAAIYTVSWSGTSARLVDDLTSWWAVSPERRVQWWAGRADAPTLPGCASLPLPRMHFAVRAVDPPAAPPIDPRALVSPPCPSQRRMSPNPHIIPSLLKLHLYRPPATRWERRTAEERPESEDERKALRRNAARAKGAGEVALVRTVSSGALETPRAKVREGWVVRGCVLVCGGAAVWMER